MPTWRFCDVHTRIAFALDYAIFRGCPRWFRAAKFSNPEFSRQPQTASGCRRIRVDPSRQSLEIYEGFFRQPGRRVFRSCSRNPGRSGCPVDVRGGREGRRLGPGAPDLEALRTPSERRVHTKPWTGLRHLALVLALARATHTCSGGRTPRSPAALVEANLGSRQKNVH